MFVLRRVLLVGEIDKKLRIAFDGEALYPQRGRGPEPGEQAIKFCDVVGDLLATLKAELYCIAKLVLGG